jgi:hypothetical protein
MMREPRGSDRAGPTAPAVVKVVCCALGLAIAAGAVACDDSHSGTVAANAGISARAAGDRHARASLHSATCNVGYIKQNRLKNVSTFAPDAPDANGFAVEFTNADASRSATVKSVGVRFLDGSGAQIGADTVRLLTLHIGPGQSLLQIFYGPNSGYVMLDNPYPGEWVSDRSMPSGARLCVVTSW